MLVLVQWLEDDIRHVTFGYSDLVMSFFVKIFHRWIRQEICTKTFACSHRILHMLLHYLAKLKMLLIIFPLQLQNIHQNLFILFI